MNSHYEFGNFEANRRFLEGQNINWENKKVLEIGCGSGSMTKFLHDLGAEIVGIDVSSKNLEVARNRFGKSMENTFLKTNGARLNFKNNNFDIVLSFDVLEHIDDVATHLREVYRVLGDGGLYLFETPNKLPSMLFDIFRYRSFTKNRKVHVSLQTKKSLMRLLRKNSFEYEFIKVDYFTQWYRNKLPKSFRWINPLKIGLETNFFIKASKK